MRAPERAAHAGDLVEALLHILIAHHGGELEVPVAEIVRAKRNVTIGWRERDGVGFLSIKAKEPA